MTENQTHSYETVYVLKSDITDEDATTIHSKVDEVIGKFKGGVKARDDWGLRELAYPINKETMGKYNVVVYEGNPGVVEEIERHFKILPNVVRFLTVRVEADYDYGKARKQIVASEEEQKKMREMRKKS